MRNTEFLQLHYGINFELPITVDERIKELEEMEKDESLENDEKEELARMKKEKDERVRLMAFHEQHERQFRKACLSALIHWAKNMGLNIPESDFREYIMVRDYDFQTVQNACIMLFDKTNGSQLYKDATLSKRDRLRMILEGIYDKEQWRESKNRLYVYIAMVMDWYYTAETIGVSQKDLFDAYFMIGLEETDRILLNLKEYWYSNEFSPDGDPEHYHELFWYHVKETKADELDKLIDPDVLKSRIASIKQQITEIPANIFVDINLGDALAPALNANSLSDLFSSLSDVIVQAERKSHRQNVEIQISIEVFTTKIKAILDLLLQ